MGLSSSQARLLSLTSREHTLEGRAQLIMSNKMRLANQADNVYAKYINALDTTQLKTAQTTETGSTVWIDANINNLLRWHADENTAGEMFFVQDLATGKLHVPTELGTAYDNATDYRSFAEQFEGIAYEKVDKNQYILDAYNEILLKGYNKALGNTFQQSEEVYDEYVKALAKDTYILSPAKNALASFPEAYSDGLYYPTSSDRFINGITNLVNSSTFKELYSNEEQNLFKGVLTLFQSFSDMTPETTEERKQYDEMDNPYDLSISYHIFAPYYKATTSYVMDNYLGTKDGTDYLNSYSLTDSDKFAYILNGGTQSWVGKAKTYINFENNNLKKYYNKEVVNDFSVSRDVYNDIKFYQNDTETDMQTLLNALPTEYSSVGDAITGILTNVIETNHNVQDLFNAKGITQEDIDHFKEYQKAYNSYQSYYPLYEYIPNNKPRAEYYEKIYNAINAAGGWIETDIARAKSSTWVNNMIKNNEVILTSWDVEEEMLSTTSSALNVNIREVNDENYIEQISQEYEAEMEEINKKDTRYDKKLSTLETERNAIEAEMQSLKQVMQDNVDKAFKLFT